MAFMEQRFSDAAEPSPKGTQVLGVCLPTTSIKPSGTYPHVMARLLPAIHAPVRLRPDVDARDKPGHDELCCVSLCRHFFTIVQAGSGGPNALLPEMVARIL